ncbi:hypothetical protein ACRXCV_05760 [Halobacteriovorax sp. GFR7]|uniref:hypothetical protein n=1 Tax=unclassified Halobacteriovorax TaxID=2639665 RepID=UPI003D978FC1
MKSVLLLAITFLLASCLKESEVTFNFGFETTALDVTLSDSSSGSTTHSDTNSIDIAKSGGDDLTQYCISETQTIAPADTSAGSCGGGNWVTGFPSSFVLSGGDGLKTVYVFGADSSSIISSEIVTKTITLDTTDPTAISALTLGTVPASFSVTPTITWTTDSTDNLVLVGYQVRVVKDSDSSVEKDWASFTKGSSVSGLFLERNEDYRIEVRAIDEAGNTSVVVSDTYTTLNVVGALTLGTTEFSLLYQPGGAGPGETESITLTNSGGLITGPLQTPLIYGSSANFQITNDTCTGTSLNPGETCSVDMTINASADGYYFAHIYITDGSIVSSEHRVQGMATGYAPGNLYYFGTWESGSPIDVYDPEKFLSVYPNDLNKVVGNLTWSKIVGGTQHSCGITTQSKLYCWGAGWFGEIGHGVAEPRYLPYIVDGEKTWKDVSTGYRLTCGIDGSDDLFCWGDNTYYRFGDGTATDSLVPKLVPGGMKWKMVSTRNFHVCAINSLDDLYCWGRNDNGQIGMGDNTTTITSPTLINSGTKWKWVVAGDSSTCAVTTAGAGYCWGLGTNNVLGNGAAANVYTPTPISGGHVFEKIDMFLFNACGLTTSNEIFCWGSDSSGEGLLGDGLGTTSSVPVRVTGSQTWVDMAARGRQPCGIDSTQQMYCWGRGSGGVTGDGDIVSRLTPTLILGGHSWASVSGSDFMSCGITITGDAYCWGRRFNNGEFGTGMGYRGLYMPKKVPLAKTWKSMAAGYRVYCGIDDTNDAYCMGEDLEGRLGNGAADTATYSHPSTIVTGGHKWASLSANEYTVCGVTTTNDGYCWGGNYYGQAGSGDTTTFHDPNLIIGGHSWSKISVGYYHTCGIRTDGAAYCWGANRFGGLGNGVATGNTTIHTTTPTAVSGGLTFTDIEVGDNFTCGLATDSKIYCWGYDGEGQLGNNVAFSHSSVPVEVVGGGVWTSISVGNEHACGVQVGGDGYCWGRGNSGSLGQGNYSNYAEPAIVTGYSWSKLVTGFWHTCGIENVTGDLYCFGYGEGGEIGNYPDTFTDESLTPLLYDRGIKFSEIFLGGLTTFGIAAP